MTTSSLILRPGQTPLNLWRDSRTPSKSAPKPAEPGAHDASPPPDILTFARQALKFPIDPIQREILAEKSNRVLINCTRQWGKSTTAAIKALHHALSTPRSLTIIASRTLAQAANIVEMAADFASDIGIRATRARAHNISLQFPNRSRILAVPGDATNRRGLSGCSLLIIDEAAYCPDKLLQTLTPTLATTNGALWLVSTPALRSGFFWQAWEHPTRFKKFSVPATQCPRISREFLEEEKSRLGPALYEAEYLCQFPTKSSDVFDLTAFDNAGPIPAPPPWTEKPSDYYIGLDIGQLQSHSALVVLQRRCEAKQGFDLRTGYPMEEEYVVLEKAEILPLGRTYSSIVQRLESLIKHLRRDRRETVALAFDATGGGSVFHEQLIAAGLDAQLCPIVITDGAHPSTANGRHRVPRNDLFHSLNELLCSKKLRVASIPSLNDLRFQLNCFTIDMKNGKPRFTSSGKDDLVLALGMAAWRARRNVKEYVVGPRSDPFPLF